MKQLSLADARRIPKSASPAATPIEDESEEEYFKKLDAKVAQAASGLLNEGLTREELAKIAANNLICFWELDELLKQNRELRGSVIQIHKKHVKLLEEKGEAREHLGIIKGWSKGFIRGKKVLAKTEGTARHTKTNEVKSYVIEQWNLHRLAYKNNKSEFSRIYARIISTKFQKQDGSALSVTEKTIRDVWLRDTPSAS